MTSDRLAAVNARRSDVPRARQNTDCDTMAPKGAVRPDRTMASMGAAMKLRPVAMVMVSANPDAC